MNLSGLVPVRFDGAASVQRLVPPSPSNGFALSRHTIPSAWTMTSSITRRTTQSRRQRTRRTTEACSNCTSYWIAPPPEPVVSPASIPQVHPRSHPFPFGALDPAIVSRVEGEEDCPSVRKDSRQQREEAQNLSHT